jgi:hypothetical protein
VGVYLAEGNSFVCLFVFIHNNSNNLLKDITIHVRGMKWQKELIVNNITKTAANLIRAGGYYF